MLKSKYLIAVCLIFVFLFSNILTAQDKAIYKTGKRGEREYEYLSIDFSSVENPEDVDEFKQYWHNDPLSQGWTGTCWCFCATSFFESELFRLKGIKVKLSEMFTVYWEYVEKARYFVEHKGDMHFGQGSEDDAVIRMMKKYGAVRLKDYTGLKPGNEKHNHSKMYREIKSFLKFIKKQERWDEDYVIKNVKFILNKHMGEPPSVINVDGTEMTPKEYLDNVLQIPFDDYAAMMTFKYRPFYTQGEFRVPDNWWHSDSYYNLPFDEWYAVVIKAIENGYTVCIGGDVSEPGISSKEGLAVVPTFDILEENIDQDAREYRFYNKTSDDDHGVHMVGYKKTGDDYWFLIKDSGGGYRGKYKGYFFFRDDFVKLKMLTYMVHKDVVKDLLKKFKKTE